MGSGSWTRHSLAVTCTPAEFETTLVNGRCEHLALGLHPWQLNAQNTCELVEAFAHQLPKTRLIGEIGLDFYGDFAQSSSVQLNAFTSICAQLEDGGYLLSLHSRKAERELLDILEANGLTRSCICILHAYNGSSVDLTRALESGCLFSLGLRELKTKRGREYARQLPATRLLLETDADGREPFSPQDQERSLEDALELLNSIRGCDMREQIADNFCRAMEFALE